MFNRSSQNSIMGWFFSQKEISEALNHRRMLNSSIDLSNACNLNCAYCYDEQRDSFRKIKKSNELSLEETKFIIDDMLGCGTLTINIVGAGEPTIDPKFEEVITYIYSKQMHTILFTNGIRLSHDQKLAKFLYEHDVSVVLKYNSKNNKLQDLIVGRDGYSIKRDKAIERLVDCGFTSHLPTRLGVDITIFKGNLNEIPDIHRWCRQENIFPIAGEFIPTGRTEDGLFQGHNAIDGFTLETQEIIKNSLAPITCDDREILINKIADIDTKYGIKRNKTWAYFGGEICTQLLGLYVDILGNIWPCVARKKTDMNNLSDGSLGNIRKGDLPSYIWNHDSYIYNLLKNYNGTCPYKDRSTNKCVLTKNLNAYSNL